MKEAKKRLEIVGKGSTKEQAISQALQSIQQKVLTQSENLYVRIEPESVEVIQAQSISRTERFLFLFMPRKRTIYQVTLSVVVSLKSIDPHAIEWTEVSHNNSSFHKEELNHH